MYSVRIMAGLLGHAVLVLLKDKVFMKAAEMNNLFPLYPLPF